MPVDIGLFRSDSDGGDLEVVRRWQTLRCDETSDENDFTTSSLEGIQKQDAERRMLLRELSTSRSRLNFLQRSLSSSNEKERGKTEANHLKQQIIPTLEQKLIQITKDLEKSLPRVANCVVTLDVEQQLNKTKHAKKSPLTSKCDEELVINPLYCLCGYETISGVTILTGTGAALAYSLSNYALQFLRKDQTFGSFPRAILPESLLSVESCTVHSLMGCHAASACPICECNNDSKIIAPSFVGASLLHQDKTYWDRQLPVGHVVTTTSSSASPLDKREVARIDSFQRGKRKLWFQQTSGERVEVLSLTGNTWGESSAMQLRMASIIVDFYKSLIVSNNTDEPSSIRIRSAAPPQLLPCEASRVIIEGAVEKKLVTLGYVSNMTDFSTRGAKTKIGGSRLGFCHAIHGLVCSIPETLEWMLAQNITHDTKELGIATPSQLSTSLQEQLGMTPLDGVLFLPFHRRVHHGKNGKVTRTELNSVSKPRIIRAGGRLVESISIGTSKPRGATFVREGPATAKDIADERMSCPFDFLPIGR